MNFLRTVKFFRLFVFLAFVALIAIDSSATLASSKPSGAKAANSSDVKAAFADKSWKWAKGGAYYASDGKFLAIWDGSLGIGKWTVNSSATLCQEAKWYWQDNGLVVETIKTCYEHVVDSKGSIWQYSKDHGWYPLKGESLKSGNRYASNIAQLEKKFGLTTPQNTVNLRSDWSSIEVTGEIFKPSGNGPFPAMVLMHGCGGILPGVEIAWKDRLLEWGYVVLLVDSFNPRDLAGGVCTRPGREWVKALDRGIDAYLGLEYLSKQAFVDKDKVGLMGWSNGGVATLAAVNKEMSFFNIKNIGTKFSAAVAFYPECAFNYGFWSVDRGPTGVGPVQSVKGEYKTVTPLLILIGSQDDWTLSSDCETLVEQTSDPKVSLIVYKNAHHSFDGTEKLYTIPGAHNINKVGGCCGASVGVNKKAKQASILETQKYLGSYLGGDAPLSMSVLEVQKRLVSLGFNPGTPDGVWGKNSLNALNEFRQSKGLSAAKKLNQESIDLMTASE